MTRKIVIASATVVLAVCLICGGCGSVLPSSSEVKSWKDMVKISPSVESDRPAKNAGSEGGKVKVADKKASSVEQREIKLYFSGKTDEGLVMETRKINKTEGIARSTIQELIKGPRQTGANKIFPAGSRLLDINIKPEGLCIVDFSREVTNLQGGKAEKALVYSIAATLSQFPSVKAVSFRVNGEEVDTLAGGLDLSQPVAAQARTAF